MSAKSRELISRRHKLSVLSNMRSSPRFFDFISQGYPESAGEVEDLPVISADNVSQYVSTFGSEALGAWRELPMRPPFDECFIDVTNSDAWSRRWGAAVTVVPQDRRFHTGELPPNLSAAEAAIAIERQMYPDASLYVDVAWFTEDSIGIELSMYAILPLDSQGVYRHDKEKFAALYVGRLAEQCAKQHPDYDPEKHKAVVSHEPERLNVLLHPLLDTVIMTLVMMNCRNIGLTKHEPDSVEAREFCTRFDTSLTKYKTLAIKSMSKRAERDDQPQQTFDVMPLHLRRGNFAHYTDDAPLFGKYTGTFWRPATVVGSEKNGIVVKDYKVTPEREAHS